MNIYNIIGHHGLIMAMLGGGKSCLFAALQFAPDVINQGVGTLAKQIPMMTWEYNDA